MILKVFRRFINPKNRLIHTQLQRFSVEQTQQDNYSNQNKSFKVQEDSELENDLIIKYLLQTNKLYKNAPSSLKISTLQKNFKYNESEINELGINLNPKDHYFNDKSNVVFIRHAYSYHNYFIDKYITSERITNKNLKQLIKDKIFKNSQEFVDSPIHPYGIIQCKNKTSQINSLNIGIVYVSPMQRTLQTCIELFKNHPNKKKIQFIVQPSVSEQLTKVSDIFDQNKFIDFIKKSYQEHGISFNCRYFYQHQWQANIIDQNFLKMPIQSSDSEQEISGDDESQQFKKIEKHLADTFTVLNLMDYYKNQPLESHSSFVKRVLLANRYIKKYSLKLKEDSEQRNQKQKMICVISHGYFIDTLFRKCFNEKHRHVDNCSFLFTPYNKEEDNRNIL